MKRKTTSRRVPKAQVGKTIKQKIKSAKAPKTAGSAPKKIKRANGIKSSNRIAAVPSQYIKGPKKVRRKKPLSRKK